MKLRAGEKFTDHERDGLSEAELEVLDAGDEEDAAALKKIAGDGADTDDTDSDDTDDTDAKADAEAKAAAAKEAAAAKAKAEESAAAADAEAKAKREADAKVKAAADAAADAAKKAGADEAAQKKAREDAEAKARADAKGEVEEEVAAEAGEEELDDDDPFLPPYVAPKPEKYEERMAAFDKREDEITAKFKAGDIELEQMDKDKRAIAKERSALEREMDRHTTTAEIADQAGARHWQWEVSRFMRDVKKHEGIDYADSIRLNTAFDAEVKALANKPENADKTGRWFLTEAHKTVKMKLKMVTAAPGAKDEAKAEAAAKAKAEADAKAKAAAARRAPTDKLPKTLGGLPAAGAVDLGKDGEGEFAEVNALLEAGDSLKVEAYIAGKSPEWQERWARNS